MDSHFETRTYDALTVRIYRDQIQLARDVASEVQAHFLNVLNIQGSAAAIMATGNSQIRFLSELVALGGLDWNKITLFHMDEYLGLPASHTASFRRYMRDRVESLVKPRIFNFIEGDSDLPITECERYTSLLRKQPIDLCCLGIGENGHLAFNDPPVASFDESAWVKIVKLDEACKMQQFKEGHFPSMEAVPPYAITLTIPALCAARRMICIAPEKRKARAVVDALKGPINTSCPASILRKQAHATLFLDQDSASLL